MLGQCQVLELLSAGLMEELQCVGGVQKNGAPAELMDVIFQVNFQAVNYPSTMTYSYCWRIHSLYINHYKSYHDEIKLYPCCDVVEKMTISPISCPMPHWWIFLCTSQCKSLFSNTYSLQIECFLRSFNMQKAAFDECFSMLVHVLRAIMQ